jgi:16S rRNA (cytosine967-C5)-methyltransferase
VNAILRRLAKDPPASPTGGSDRAVSLRTGMAEWAVAELRTFLTPEDVEPAATGFGQRAPLTLRVNTCRSTVEDVVRSLRDAGLQPRLAPVHPECILLPGGDPTSIPGWHEGWFAVQDQASAFVVDTLAPEPGDRILDACAAPGGKTALIACRVGDAGRLVASDLRPERIAPIGTALARLGLRADLLAHDAGRPAVRGPFDRVLVDAPCTGIGSARRRPELLWRGRRDELSRLARLQVAIVAAGAELLRTGGRLVYSVCTFPRAETDAACDAIVRHRPDLVPVETPGPAGAPPEPRHRLWPHRHGTDGMFVAAFERSG